MSSESEVCSDAEENASKKESIVVERNVAEGSQTEKSSWWETIVPLIWNDVLEVITETAKQVKRLLPDSETKVEQTSQATKNVSGGRESHIRTSDKMREVTIKVQMGRTEGDVPIQKESLQRSSRNTVGTDLKGFCKKNSTVSDLQKRLKLLADELRELSQLKQINDKIETESQIAMIRNASASVRPRTDT